MPAPDGTAPLLWYTDRSRFETGTSRCARKRYLTYHAGPTGYGFVAARESLPLATGLAFHQGTELLDRYLLANDALPPDDVVRQTILQMQLDYREKCAKSGYQGILDSEVTAATISEQCALLSGMVWTYQIQILPWLHTSYRVLAVEEPKAHFLSCTCGAGPLDLPFHVERDCQGIVLMQRQDLLAEHRSSRQLAYFEKKTTGWDSDAWAEQWETKPQLGLGTLDTARVYGREVTELFIIGLSKGPRRREQMDPTGRKLQMSPLCYGYLRAGNQPLSADDWLPAYQWQEDGQTRRASRAHKRTAIAQLAQSDWPLLQSLQATYPGAPVEELWVRYCLPASVTEKVCFILGPMNRQDRQLESLVRAMTSEEERWRDHLWYLYEHPDDPTVLDRLIPQSWACRPFGKEYQCEHHGICFGGEDPITSGHFKPRVPHHRAEYEAAIARGLLPAEGEQEEID